MLMPSACLKSNMYSVPRKNGDVKEAERREGLYPIVLLNESSEIVCL